MDVSSGDPFQSQNQIWRALSPVTRFEWMQHYHKERCTAEEAAEKLGVTVKTFMKHAPDYIDLDKRIKTPFEKQAVKRTVVSNQQTRKPDLRTYKKVVVYIKEAEPAYPDEPKILITENNLTKSVIQVHVLDASEAANNSQNSDDDEPPMKFRRTPQSAPRQPIQRVPPPIQDEDDDPEPPPSDRNSPGIPQLIPAEEEVYGDPDYVEESPLNRSVKSPSKKPIGISHKAMLAARRPPPKARDEPVIGPDGKPRLAPMFATGVKDWMGNLHLVKRILGQDYLLSSQLTRTMIAVRDENAPIYRRMCKTRITEDGYEKFACGDCKAERRKVNDRHFRIPTINLNTGEFNHLEHMCQGATLVEIIAKEIDRCNRLILTGGTETSKKKVWEMGRIRALEITEEFGFPRTGKESIMEHYPDYKGVSAQYNRMLKR